MVTSLFDSPNLSELDGSNGFVIQGTEAGSSLTSASSAGDVNGDGFDDLIIGTPEAGTGSDDYSYEGESYLVFGSSSFEPTLELATLNGSNGFVLNGIDEYDNSGYSVSGAGDFNGDGFDDLIIGAPFAGTDSGYNSGEGESYVVFGSSGFAPTLDLATLDGSNGFLIQGIDEYDNSGFSVSGAGDVNGDGFNDLIIGAPEAGPGSDDYSYEGESYVVFGSSGFAPTLDLATLDGSNGFLIQGIDEYDNSGFSVSGAGDVNGDGFDDLIIGASNAGTSSGYNSGEGESYVVFGSSSGFAPTLDLATLDGSNGFLIQGIDSGDEAGFSVSGTGDVNGDGFNDLIIGAPEAGTNFIIGAPEAGTDSGYNSGEGESYVVFGSSSFEPTLELATLNGSNGFVLNGIDEYDNSGYSVSGAGDFNGDGFDDLIIGAPFAGTGSGYNIGEGESYVVFGSSSFEPTLELATLNGSNGFLLRGIESGDTVGFFVSDAGDVNGDGTDDLIVGAPFAGPDGDFSAGESYVIFGVLSLELIGTENDDILTGSDSIDLISGLVGDDIIEGLAGNDQILGGRGDDLIIAGEGNDVAKGGAGADAVSGDEGNDNITGGSGADAIFGGLDNDRVKGGSGNDRISGDLGSDTLNGNAGQDIVDGGLGNDSVWGGQGKDRILGEAGEDHLSGGDKGDILIGGFNNDRLRGNTGDDRLIGIDLSDPDLGAGEVDTLTGGVGSDTFVLADTRGVFYMNQDSLSAGGADFALITDFDASEDFIQLQGAAEFYQLDFFTSSSGSIDASLIYDPGVSARGEVIGILQGASTDLSITAPAFTFVNSEQGELLS